jgi:prepilin peptidase CpaA
MLLMVGTNDVKPWNMLLNTLPRATFVYLVDFALLPPSLGLGWSGLWKKLYVDAYLRLIAIEEALMLLRDCLCFVLVVACAATDLAAGKVLNKITYTAAGLGLVASILIRPTTMLSSLLGLALGLGMYFLLYRFTGLGAGDVKLMAAIGAIKGLSFVMLASFYIFCAACIWGLFTLASKGTLLTSMQSMFVSAASGLRGPLARQPVLAKVPRRSFSRMPFAPAICLGVSYSLFLEHAHGPLQLVFF